MFKRLLVKVSAAVVLVSAAMSAQPASMSNTSTTKLTLGADSVSWGDVVTLSADVSASGEALSAGSVLFLEDGLILSASQVTGTSPAVGFRTGSAILKRAFSIGKHQLTAKFVGYGQFAPSESAIATLTVSGTAPVAVTIASDSSVAPVVHFDLASLGTIPTSGGLNLFNVASGSSVEAVSISQNSAQLTDHVRSFPAEGQPAGLVLGDFNGDGLVDMAVTDPNISAIKIFLSDKNGVLPSAASFSLGIGGRPGGIATGDLNGDGILDLVTIDESSGSLTVWFGDPDHPGSFVALEAPTLLGQGLASLIIADLNGDGILDIAVTNAVDGNVLILLGSSFDPGHFALAQTLSISGVPYAIAVGDLYGNGLSDLAVASYQSGEVWILKNNPQSPGTFIIPDGVQKVGSGPSSILIADVTGDSIPDVIVCDSLDNQVSVLVGVASTRGFFPTERILNVGSAPVSVALLGQKVDGHPDLVVSNQGDGTLEVLENDSTGAFKEHRVITAGQSSTQVLVSGANSSVYPTLMTLDPSASLVHTIQQQWSTDGTFAPLPIPSDGETLNLQAKLLAGGGETLSNEINIIAEGTPQTISFASASNGIYGQSLALTATASSGLPVSFRVVSGSATIAGSELIPSGVGTVVVEARQDGNAFFVAAPPVSIPVVIGPASLRVVAAAAQRPFGVSNPQFTGNIIGLVAGDPVQAIFTSLATTETPAGVYVTLPNAVNPTLQDPEKRLSNYTVTLTPASLTILDVPAFSVTSTTTAIPTGSLPIGSVTTSGQTNSSTDGSATLPAASSSSSSQVSSTEASPITEPTSSSQTPVTSIPVTVTPGAAGSPSQEGNTGSNSVVAPTTSSPEPVTPIPSTGPPASPSSTTQESSTGSNPTTSPSSSSSTSVASSPGPISSTTTLPSSATSAPTPVPVTAQPSPTPIASLPLGPVKLKPAPTPTHTSSSPFRFPISVGSPFPILPFHALYLPIPVFGWHTHEAKRSALAMWLSEGGPEKAIGDVGLYVHFDFPKGLTPFGEIAVVERGRELARTPINGYFNARILLHSVTPGPHTLMVQFSGDAQFAPTKSNLLEISVSTRALQEDVTIPISNAPHKENLTLLSNAEDLEVSVTLPNESLSTSQKLLQLSKNAFWPVLKSSSVRRPQPFSLDLQPLSARNDAYSYFSESDVSQTKEHGSSKRSPLPTVPAHRAKARKHHQSLAVQRSTTSRSHLNRQSTTARRRQTRSSLKSSH